MMYRYSIIVTFYNAEKYIDRTLKNILGIVDKNIEIIIVDDGSTDKTLDIINRYNIPNSKIISQKNMGVSSARNKGLEYASGKYVMFLDGDDWLDINTFNILNEYYDKDYDIIKFGFIFTDLKKNNKFEIVNDDRIVEKNQIQKFINEMLSVSKFNSASNQLVKRKILLDNNIYFVINRKFAEDFEFNLKLLTHVNKICLLKKCLYYYYFNSDSTTKSYNKENAIKCLEDALSIYTKSITFYKKVKCSEFIFYDTVNRSFNEIAGCLKKLYYVDNISNKEIYSILNKFYDNEKYIKFYNILVKNNYKPNNYVNKLIFNKKILKYNGIILILYKLKKEVI